MNVCMLQILFFDSINVSQGINVNKTSGSKGVIFITIGIFQLIVLSFNQVSAIDVIIY